MAIVRRAPSWQELIRYIREVEDGPRSSNRRPWTRHVKRLFAKKARLHGALSYPDESCADRNSQYMLDVAWADERDGEPFYKYRGLMLALECEWNTKNEDLWYDFVKVVDIQADRRVFLGQRRPTHGVFELEHDGSKFVTEIEQFLHHHRHFEDDAEVLMALWNCRTPKSTFAARLFRGDGTSELVCTPSSG